MPTLNFTSVNGVTNFTAYYPESIDLSGSEYEAALLELSTYNSKPNIKKNVSNIFRYSLDNGITWKEIIFNIGSYEFAKNVRDRIMEAPFDVTCRCSDCEQDARDTTRRCPPRSAAAYAREAPPWR